MILLYLFLDKAPLIISTHDLFTVKSAHCQKKIRDLQKSYSSNRIRNSACSSLRIFRMQVQKTLQKSRGTISAMFYVTLVNLFWFLL